MAIPEELEIDHFRKSMKRKYLWWRFAGGWRAVLLPN
jgi:hypothetical protein